MSTGIVSKGMKPLMLATLVRLGPPPSLRQSRRALWPPLLQSTARLRLCGPTVLYPSTPQANKQLAAHHSISLLFRLACMHTCCTDILSGI